MNTIYKVIWNAATNSWVAAPEFAKSRGKKSQLRKSVAVAAIALAIYAPFGAAFASEACELADGQDGVLNDKDVCVAEGRSIAPRYEAGGGDDSGVTTNVSIGSGSTATGTSATALGTDTRAETLSSTAVGSNAHAFGGTGATALGRIASANGEGAVALGSGTSAVGTGSTAVGFNAQATSAGNTALGRDASASALSTTAIGQFAAASGNGSIAIGGSQAATTAAAATGVHAVAIGENAKAAGADSIAIGANANVSGTASSSIALGQNSVADRDNTLSVGSATVQRQIVNVAAGTENHDATNFAQLKGTAGSIATAIGGGSVVNADGTISAPSYTVGGTTVNSIGDAFTNIDGRTTANTTNLTNLDGRVSNIEGDLNNGTIGLVKQDATTNAITVAGDKAGTSVSFAGTSGARTLSGVAAGTLSATSDEAVNGSQLLETNNNVTHNSAAIAMLNGRVDMSEVDIRDIKDQISQIDEGAIGLVKQDATTHDISVAAASGGTSVNFAGTDGARVLSGVANGVDDQDVATIAQLKASGLVDPNDGRALGALVYDDLSLDRATLGGTNGTVIANVGNGLIAIGSREAVNGGQLASIRDDLQKQIGDVSDRVETIEDSIADGSIGGPGGGDGAPIDDNGGRPISNVGDGVADSDAATVGQVNKKYEQAVTEANAYTDTRFDQLQSDVNHRFAAVDDRIDRMAALSGAYAGMAMNTAGLAGKNRVGAGVGAQSGKSALAVGYQRIVGKQNNASVSLGGAFSGSEKSVSAGAGFSW